MLPDEAMADLTTHLESFGTWKAVTPDAIASAKLEVYDEEVAILRQSVIATAPEDICYERIPGNGRSSICERCASASQGGGVCNLVAKVFIDLTFTADIALQNAGGCRADIEAGDFSIGDAFSVLPFQNTLVTAPVTGVQVKTLLEEGLANFIDLGGSTGSYPYAYGLRYDVDISAAAGSRITNLEVNPRVAGEWMPIDDAATYVLVTNSFVAGGGGRDGYDTFSEVPEITDTFIEYGQALVTFASEEGELVDIPLEDYSTQSFLPVPEGC
jgi:5'-nucleotidase/UDP-sugar diphosphatase